MDFITFVLILLFGSFSWKILETYYYLPNFQVNGMEVYGTELYDMEENICWSDIETYLSLC
jgi:hypothetical protein